MAGAGRVRLRRSRRLREAPHRRAAAAAGVAPEEWRDWAGGLPDEVLGKVVGEVVAQNEAGWAAWLKECALSEEEIEDWMAWRKSNGNCLFVFARVCRGWRKAQLKVGGPLRTRVESDVILPGSVALAKWALAEGCPRRGGGFTMAHAAAGYGHLELVKWLCGEGGFAMDERVMWRAACSGNLELVQWLQGKGCPWDKNACSWAVDQGHVEVLRWLRENGCPWEGGVAVCEAAVSRGHVEVLRWARKNGAMWYPETRDKAAELGYTDNFANLDASVQQPWQVVG